MENADSIVEVLKATKFLRHLGGHPITQVPRMSIKPGDIAWVSKMLAHHLIEKYSSSESVKIEVIEHSELDKSHLKAAYKKPWTIDPWIRDRLTDVQRHHYLIENPNTLIKIFNIHDGSSNPLPESSLSTDRIMSNEIAVRNVKIKKQRETIKILKLRQERPTYEELKVLIDENRKGTGKVNYAKLGKILGRDPETAKRWINKVGLQSYALKAD